MDKQSKEAKEMAKNLPLKDKLLYIWEYYKSWIIGIPIALILIGSTIYEIATRPTYDMEISLFSECYFSDEMIIEMENYISQFVDDVDGNGIKNVKIYPTNGPVNKTGDLLVDSNKEAAVAIQTKFAAEITASSYPVYLLDDFFNNILDTPSYDGAFEKSVNINKSEELMNIVNPAQGKNIYWCTRALYEKEKDDEKRLAEYELAQKVQQSIFD